MSDGKMLTTASTEWATRPADERFPSLQAMYDATKAHADRAREKAVPWGDLRVEACGENDLCITGRANVPATVSYYAAGQLASRVGAPAGYIRSLPAALAAQNLNFGLKQRGAGDTSDAHLLFELPSMDTGRPTLRAALSEKYSRIWNYEVVARLIDASARYDLVPAVPMAGYGAQGAPVHADPALYASAHDMFAFLNSRERAIVDPIATANAEGLFRGVIVRNSEVGDCSLSITGFLFRTICSNFCIWGARDIAEVRLTHVGDIRGRWSDAMWKVRNYLDGSDTETVKLQQAASAVIGGTKDEVLDRLFGVRSLGASRKLLSAGYDAVVVAEDGPANTLFGMAQGLTRHSQSIPFADERTQVDRIAGKVLDLVF